MKCSKLQTSLQNNRFSLSIFNEFWIVLSIFAISGFFSAYFSPVQDCDEVFNYWEPTHYLNHGTGLQTWEYSPEFALRSWLYICLHALLISFVRSFSFVRLIKWREFYTLRLLLALFSAYCQTRLYHALAVRTNKQIARIFGIIQVTSTGMFHASSAYLPSSFAMNFFTLSLTQFFYLNLHKTLLHAAIACLLGWPFAGVLVAPFILYYTLHSYLHGVVLPLVVESLRSLIYINLIWLFQIIVDSTFYRKLTIVAWNIVSYNVFGESGLGPQLYGTEPWYFYSLNLLLNYNIWFILALLVGPIILMRWVSHPHRSLFTRNNHFHMFCCTAPFYIWLIILSFQPHKEERFIYPIYSNIALNAAISLYFLSLWPRQLLNFFGHPKLGKLTSVILPFLTISLGCSIAILRSINLSQAYSAPLHVTHALQNVSRSEVNVCISKDWYRFPSSYFMGKQTSLKFVRSSFQGLLPGEFLPVHAKGGFYPGTWTWPKGMNNKNFEDPSKYFDPNKCDYMMELTLPSFVPSAMEPIYMLNKLEWQVITCQKFLDVQLSGKVARYIWLPDQLFNWLTWPALDKKWGNYCLLERIWFKPDIPNPYPIVPSPIPSNSSSSI